MIQEIANGLKPGVSYRDGFDLVGERSLEKGCW